MAQRGRKSKMATSMIKSDEPLVTAYRPRVPKELDEEEGAEWKATVDRMPVDWFPRETHCVLVQYCRHVVRARHIAGMIKALEQEQAPPQVFGQPAPPAFVTVVSLERLSKLLVMQRLESNVIATLATKMRLTQQSTIDKESKKRGVGKKPWQE